MFRKIMVALLTILGLYIFMCALVFVMQEKLIFLPDKLRKDHEFRFAVPFEELYIRTSDDKLLHGLLFTTHQPKGLVFYLHGNAGCLENWGEVAQVYTSLNYDVFLLDYRGYGKSDGQVKSEDQLHQDVRAAYDEMRKRYDEDKIVVLGYSLGSGPASKLAAENSPRLLILQAPYFSLKDVAKRSFPFIPVVLLKYKLETNRYITACKMPVVLIHGDQDEVIYYESSLKLKALLKPTDTLITLAGQGHNGMTFTPDYQKAIAEILE